MWLQKTVQLSPKERGFHLITNTIIEQLPELSRCHVGLLHLSLQHTSASLTLNENADPAVRRDFEQFFNQLVPEQPGFEHNDEGPDDLPAHFKASLLGQQLTLPVRQGQLALGLWQGIYLGEHRNHAASRTLVLTLNGNNENNSLENH